MNINHSQHIADLDNILESISGQINDLGSGKHVSAFRKIIHGPGWTTPAELAFARGIADAISSHLALVNQLHALLVKAGGMVGQE